MRRTAAIVLAILLAACGGDGATSTTQPDTPATTVPAEAPTTSEAGIAASTTTATPQTTAATSVEGVPDACELIDAAELSALIGMDVGEGDMQSGSPDRSVCFYAAGPVTAIEIAANYELSRQLIDEDGRETEDVPGLGNGAFYDPFGQVVALGDRYFVAISAAESVEVLTQVAAALLEAAEG